MATLRDHRLQRLWSQHELARRSGVAVRTVVSIEADQRPPRLQTMRRIADALGIDWTEVDEFRSAMAELEEKAAA